MNTLQKNRWFSLLVALLIVVNIVMIAMFWWQHKNRPEQPAGGRGNAAEFVIKALALDSNQQQAYQQLREEHQQQMRAIKERSREQKEAYLDLFTKDSVTDEVKNAAIDANAAIEKETALVTYQHFRKLRALCNAQQKEKFNEIIGQVLRMMSPPPGGRRPDKHGPRPGPGEMTPPPFDDSAAGGRPPHGEMPPPEQ
jgi:protein CpxP